MKFLGNMKLSQSMRAKMDSFFTNDYEVVCVCDLISGMKPEKEWTDWIELKDRVQSTVVECELPIPYIGGPKKTTHLLNGEHQ